MWSSSRAIHRYTAGLIVTALLSGAPAYAAGASHSSTAAPASVHIDNFGQVNDQYYRGGQPKGADFAALSSLGIKLVIDLAQEGDPAEEAHATAAGMRFVRIPMTTHEVPSPTTITKFLSLVNDPANQPVYVHCMGGRHRTGVMTAIYRMTVDHWTPMRAFSEMKQYKFGAEFLHPEFKAFIDTYVVPSTPPPAAR